MQFRYHAGNNFGTSKDGKSCQGCAIEQEEIYNCADIEIVQNLNRLVKLEEAKNTTEESSSMVTTIATNNALKLQDFYLLSIILSFKLIFA